MGISGMAQVPPAAHQARRKGREGLPLQACSRTRRRRLPDGCATLSVLAPESGPLECVVTGPRLGPGERVTKIGEKLYGVRLKPGVVCALTGVPAHRLTDKSTSLASLL